MAESHTKRWQAPNVVVAFEYVEDTDDPGVVLARDRRQVESLFHATDLRVTEHTLCGLPAQTVDFRIPATGIVAPRAGRAPSAILHTSDHTCAVLVTAQTANRDNVTHHTSPRRSGRWPTGAAS